jgi:hypothetical protein
MSRVQCTLTNPSGEIYNPLYDYTRAKILRGLLHGGGGLTMTRQEAARLATFLARRLVRR